MYNRNFHRYFRINKFFLQFGGVLPFLSWGFMVNGVFMILPICTCLFLTLPGFYIMISHLKVMAATKVLSIFCDLIEILVVAFQGVCVCVYSALLAFTCIFIVNGQKSRKASSR